MCDLVPLVNVWETHHQGNNSPQLVEPYTALDLHVHVHAYCMPCLLFSSLLEAIFPITEVHGRALNFDHTHVQMTATEACAIYNVDGYLTSEIKNTI